MKEYRKKQKNIGDKEKLMRICGENTGKRDQTEIGKIAMLK